MTAELLECLPSGSTAVFYGSMREVALQGFDPLSLIGRDYAIDSFILGRYILSKGNTGILPLINQATSLMNDATLQSTIQKKIKFSEFQKGIKDSFKNMTAGKIILNPWEFDEAVEKAEPHSDIFKPFDIKGIGSD